MSTTFSDISAVLESKVVELSQLAIAWENWNFDPATEGQDGFVALSLMPAQVVPATIGTNGLDKHSGFLNLAVTFPEGQGRGDADSTADRIATLFRRGTTLTHPNGLELTVASVSRGQGRTKDGWYSVPVTVEYFTHVPA